MANWLPPGFHNELSVFSRLSVHTWFLRSWLVKHEHVGPQIDTNLVHRLFPWMHIPHFLLVCAIWSPDSVRSFRRGIPPIRCSHRTDRLATFLSISIVASAFSSILAVGLMQMDGIAGYRGWRWIFVSNFSANNDHRRYDQQELMSILFFADNWRIGNPGNCDFLLVFHHRVSRQGERKGFPHRERSQVYSTSNWKRSRRFRGRLSHLGQNLQHSSWCEVMGLVSLVPCGYFSRRYRSNT